MDKRSSALVENNEAEKIDPSVGTSTDEQSRQIALGKISRRYAAYIVPATLAVLSNRASAGSP